MNRTLGFVRTTLVGGLMFLVPIIVLLAILGKAIQIAHQISPPVLRVVEAAGLGHILSPRVVALLLLVLFCFLAGLFSRSSVAKRMSRALEENVLSNLPGYAFIKGFAESLAGVEASAAHDPVMVRIEDAWQIAFVVDRLDDGHLAVYVPGVPDGRSGSLYFMTAERVEPLKISLPSVMHTLRRMGVGSRELLQGGIGTKPT